MMKRDLVAKSRRVSIDDTRSDRSSIAAAQCLAPSERRDQVRCPKGRSYDEGNRTGKFKAKSSNSL